MKKRRQERLIVIKNGYNTNYCFLVRFQYYSGKRRFFVWDFKGDSVKYASLCAHGYGKNSTVSKPVFSNVEGSYCSSLGNTRWVSGRIASGESIFIINYMDWKRRMIMLSSGISCLHSYTPLPETEVYPLHLPLDQSRVSCNIR